ncbi:MAG TPA: lysylphosphatidylglycerol synthase transmembrane domain-containing protein, partial [Gemmatimonadales bacterium]|nr:lysylphosphatidylglycerol synthase transmembrane domain-containing protein [Gemmatimonadales bacterium]
MKIWIKVLVSVGLLALLFWLLPWAQVRDALLRLPPESWLLVLCGFVLGHLIGVVKWRIFVNAGRAALRFRDAIQCYAAGLFTNLCLPSIVGGDVLRAAMAARITRRPEAAFLGGVIDRITDMVAMVILIAAGGLTSSRVIPGWGGEAFGVGLILGGALLVIFLPILLRRPLSWWPRRIRRQVGRSLVALRRLVRSPRAAATALLLSLTIQSSFVLLNRTLGQAIGIDVPLPVWFLVWPLAKVAGLMPISLGGLAVREATLATLLTPFGVPFALGVVCSLLWQTVLIVGGLCAGLLWVVLR